MKINRYNCGDKLIVRLQLNHELLIMMVVHVTVIGILIKVLREKYSYFWGQP